MTVRQRGKAPAVRADPEGSVAIGIDQANVVAAQAVLCRVDAESPGRKMIGAGMRARPNASIAAGADGKHRFIGQAVRAGIDRKASVVVKELKLLLLSRVSPPP